MMGVRYTICHWAINRADPQNSLSTTLDVPLQRVVYYATLLFIILGELLGEINYIIVRFLEYDTQSDY